MGKILSLCFRGSLHAASKAQCGNLKNVPNKKAFIKQNQRQFPNLKKQQEGRSIFCEIIFPNFGHSEMPASSMNDEENCEKMSEKLSDHQRKTLDHSD